MHFSFRQKQRVINSQRFGRCFPLHPPFYPCWTILVGRISSVKWTGVQPVTLRQKLFSFISMRIKIIQIFPSADQTCGPKVFEIPHLQRLYNGTLVFFNIKKNRRKGTLPREVQDTLTIFRIWELLKLTIRLLTLQHSRTTGVLLAGIMTILYSSGSVSHEQDNPHDHGNCNCDRVVRECGGKTFKQKRCSH